MGNPLLLDFKTPFEAAPFTKIKTEHFIPALQYSIDVALKEINKLVQNKEIPTFQNTLDALENCGSLIGRNSSLLFNLNSAETSDSLQKVAQEAAPLLTKFQNDIRLNETLFKRIQFVYENENREKLNTEQLTLLEKEYKGFVRNGALLKQDAKEKLRTIDTELAQLSLSFGENVLADTQTYILHVQKEKNLKGLPENIVEMAQQIAEQKGLKGWIFTLDYPSYVPFMTYSENRELRKELSLAFGKRGFQDNNHNNSVVILKIIKLRLERAKLLGYESHAAFVLEERMAKSEKNVESFLNNLSKKAHPVAKKEWNTMEAFAKENLGISTLEKWDTAFVAEKLKQEEFDLNEQVLKPYFPLNKVLDGLFQIIERLYGLSFYKTTKIDTYQEEVDVYEVKKSDQFHALLYTDFFPRPGKRNGAWMTSYRSQKKGQRPHISIVCNFSQPTKTQPSLLTFQEVTTLFHEFGHALHGILANTTYSGLSGTSVYWDFVELPSQIMENWCYEPAELAQWARHYATGEAMPADLVARLAQSQTFLEGLATVRQLGFGLLDMAWHDARTALSDLEQLERDAFASVDVWPSVNASFISPSFSHIFAGGYSAGYYSYKWAEVLDADAYGFFREAPDQAAPRFRTLLESGGTVDPMDLYVAFRGRQPQPEALLRRAGLLNPTA